MRKSIFGAVCALAASMLLFGTASAQVKGTITGNYSYLDASGGFHVNDWGGSGSLFIPFQGTMLGGQFDTSYNSLTSMGYTTGLWQVGGAGGYTGDNWRAGIDWRYFKFDQTGTAHYTTFGGGIEFYPKPSWTLGANGGVISGSDNGLYLGAMTKYYPCPRFVASAAIDYTKFSSYDYQTSYGLRAEYMLSPTTPISFAVGYNYLAYNGGANANVYSAGFTWYIDTSGNAPASNDISYYQRQGQYGWILNGPGALTTVY